MKPKYPHMRQWESQIMEKYHKLYPNKGEWSYDVHLKVRQNPAPELESESLVELYNQATAKRIDAVCETQGVIFVIEIKDRLRPSALGQALTYKALYEEQFAPSKPVEAVILTEYTDLDMRHVCDLYGVLVWVV